MSGAFCIDAGVVVKLVVSPENNPLLQVWERWEDEQSKRFAPSLLFYEVTSALYRYQKLGLLSSQAVGQALEAALALPVDLVSDMALHRQAKLLAEKYNLAAAYDAHYLALAERMGLELYTTDIGLINTLSSQGVTWVKDIK